MARPRSEEAQQRVLDAAALLIAEVGVDGFTVDAVVERSGVAKTTIYRRWKSANELLIATLEASVEAIATPNTGSLRTDIIELYTSVAVMLEQPQILSMFFGVLGRVASDPEFARLKRELEYERYSPLRAMVELAQARGEIPAHLDVDFVTDVIDGPLAARTVIRMGTFTATEIEQIADLLVAGLNLSAPVSDT